LINASDPEAGRGDHGEVLARPAWRVQHHAAGRHQLQQLGDPFPLPIRRIFVLVAVLSLVVIDRHDGRLPLSQPRSPVHS